MILPTTSLKMPELIAQEVVKLPTLNIKDFLSTIRGGAAENLDDIWLSWKFYMKIRSLVQEITGESKLPLDLNQDALGLRDDTTWFIVRVLNGLTPDANISIDVSETRVCIRDLPLDTLNRWTHPQLKALIKPLVDSCLDGSVNLHVMGQSGASLFPSLVPN
jgi:hypothetical protein